MCCEAFWKRVIAFCLTFGLGVLVSSVFVPNKISANLPQPSAVKKQSTLFNPPKVPECINPLIELKKQKSYLLRWLDENKDAAKKQRLDKIKELEEVNFQIFKLEVIKNLRDFQRSQIEEEGLATNLLYKEKCYDLDGRK